MLVLLLYLVYAITTISNLLLIMIIGETYNINIAVLLFISYMLNLITLIAGLYLDFKSIIEKALR